MSDIEILALCCELNEAEPLNWIEELSDLLLSDWAQELIMNQMMMV